jgi:TolB-like protein/cytochrome c-type biogenesis protein CcmH/NrfG
MSSEHSEVKFEIAHVLFIDIVGYSKLMINEQSAQIQKLREIVRATDQFRTAEAEGKLLRLPTGDGGALVFRTTPEAPVLCALEISKALKNHPEIKVRMGIHSGPVNAVTDLNEQANVAGAGINIAQRVMDCGDAGHILLSRHVAEDLEHYPRWRDYLHPLGEVEIKHGDRISVVNFYQDELGNPEVPRKFENVEAAVSAAGKLDARQRSRACFRRWAVGILTGTALVFAALMLIKHHRQSSASAVSGSQTTALPAPEKSIAVLPFENLSRDPDNAYFADGIQDEILTRLSKVAALKVISRTSTQKYKSAPDNLRDIGKQLGVANLLEGSVQKIANAVHVNVQLIRCSSDEHLWAESYNRKLDDVFAVEGEVAGAIADQLNAKLTGAEKRELAARPTNNPEAYDAYLRGSVEFWQATEASANAAVRSFEEAVRLDPQFAGAWAALSRAQSMVFFHYDKTPSRRDSAEKALNQAFRLQPDLTEAQLARGYFQYWVERNYQGALTLMQQLRTSLPNNAEILQIISFISARLGKWKDSVDCINKAVELNPRDMFTRVQADHILMATRDFVGAIQLLDNALQIWPNNTDLLGSKAEALQASGRLDDAQSVLNGLAPNFDEADSSVSAFWVQARLRRSPEAAIKAFAPHIQKVEGDKIQMLLLYADLLEIAGRKAESQQAFTRARDKFEALLVNQPTNDEILGPLTYAYAGLGQRDAAEKVLEKFKALAANDARRMGTSEDLQSRIMARFGNKDEAISSLQRALSQPCDGITGMPPTPELLRLDPDYDSLRGDPRFEKLCQEK